jgi:hypothetical protein
LDHLEGEQDPTKRFSSNFGLYKIEASGELKLSLVANSRANLCTATQIGPPKILSHPCEPIIVVYFPQAGGGAPVIIWHFDKGLSSISKLQPAL